MKAPNRCGFRDGRQLEPMKLEAFADYVAGKVASRDLAL
jgi:hypothetical protein